MNPPFENHQDIKHVRHAYDLLAEGGRMVAIMSEHPFFAKHYDDVEFRDWLEKTDMVAERLPQCTFEESDVPTGVNTRIVVIDKNLH